MTSIPTEPLPPLLETAIQSTADRIHQAWDGEGVAPAKTVEGARLAWEHIYGYLRGRIPDPIPNDLYGVAVSAGLRMAKGFAHTGTMFLANGNYNDQADFRPWMGFMLVERITLNRYRQTTA